MSRVGQTSATPVVDRPLRLQATNISVRFGGVQALDSVSLRVPVNSVVGLVGPNGAGKSTLFAVMSGLLKPQRGRVLIDGEDVTAESAAARSKRGLARTFQHPQLVPGLTVRDHLVLGYRARYTPRRVWSDLFVVSNVRGTAAAETASVELLLSELGLERMADRPVVGLPLGITRLVDVGRALAFDPSLLLLDEPSAGLDEAETARLEETLVTLAQQRKLSLLLVEHNLDLVMRMSEEIFVIDFGIGIDHGPPSVIRDSPAVRTAYLGTSSDTEPSPGATA